MSVRVMHAGTAEGREHSADTEVYLSEFYEAKLPKHGVKAAVSISRQDICFRPKATILLR